MFWYYISKCKGKEDFLRASSGVNMYLLTLYGRLHFLDITNLVWLLLKIEHSKKGLTGR